MGKCDCFPEEDEVVHAIPKEMYSWNSFLGVRSCLGYFLKTSTNGFLFFFCHFNLKMCCFTVEWLHNDQVRQGSHGGLSTMKRMAYFYGSPKGNGQMCHLPKKQLGQ
jgi:hypothetical protein